MLVEFKHKKYAIHFHHVTIFPNKNKRRRFVTYCWISKLGKKKEDNKILCNAHSKCNPIDKINRNVGKRIALNRALDGINNKDFRKLVWEGFNNEFPIN